MSISNNNKTMEQIQVRIDSRTKKQAKEILESLGLDMSTAIKMFFRQVINAKNIPYEIRDVNGFTLRAAQELREAVAEAEANKKSFSSAKDLINDVLS